MVLVPHVLVSPRMPLHHSAMLANIQKIVVCGYVAYASLDICCLADIAELRTMTYKNQFSEVSSSCQGYDDFEMPLHLPCRSVSPLIRQIPRPAMDLIHSFTE